LASCVPCPRGTYSLDASLTASDTVASQCRPCPFGASCNGGNFVSSSKSYWGWKVSESELTSRFMLLPTGYGCEENCSSISPCGGYRTGILCGACYPNYSIAFFQTECVPSVQCASWKWGALFFLCLVYQFFFSLWLFWSSEGLLLQQQSDLQFEGKRALEGVSLFETLSPDQIGRILSKMELVNVAAQTNLITQGRPGQFMFIIKRGILNVYMFDDTGGESLKSRLTAPSVVGELSLITGDNCAASIRTSEDCELWRLDRSCLEDVAEKEKLSYIEMKRAAYAKPATSKSTTAVKAENGNSMGDAFGILMWFYQLAGVMLSTSSPLSYLNGSAIAYSIVSFFVNAKPSSEAAADLTTKSSITTAAEKFQFCVSSDFNTSQMYISSFGYYILWALLMAILAKQGVWSFVRNNIFRVSFRLAQFMDIVTGHFQRCFAQESETTNKTLQEMIAERENIEIRGPVVLKWFVTCFSAISTLMIQGTLCFHLDGLRDAAGELRWVYDGRVVCFSNAGDLPGEWQVASVVGVVVVLIAPAALWRIMVRLQRLGKQKRSNFQESALLAYSGIYCPNARHWQVVL
jgi:hypothetical protein